MIGMEREVSIREAADARGLNRRTLQAAVKSGKLSARRVADVWVVKLSAVDRWLGKANERPGPLPMVVKRESE